MAEEQERYVNGLLVVATEPTELNITRPGTRTKIVSDKVLRMLLADGSEIYGCSECDYVNVNQASILPHRNSHRKLQVVTSESSRKKAGDFTVREVIENIQEWMAPVMDLTMTELIDYLSSYKDVTTEQMHWEQRALNAEARLKQLQDFLIN